MKKRHNALSYHRVREACAAGAMWFIHTPGKTNVADVLTKYLPWCDMKDKIGPILFWKGDTMDFPTPKLRGVTDGSHCEGCEPARTGNEKDIPLYLNFHGSIKNKRMLSTRPLQFNLLLCWQHNIQLKTGPSVDQ